MGRVRLAVAGLACVAAVAMLAFALSPSSPQAPEELAGVAHGNFLSTLLAKLEGKTAVPSQGSEQGSKQLLARKWWECGNSACDEAPRTPGPSMPAVGVHMGELDKYRKKNCATLECYYANSATGWNVPGTGKETGHRWGADGELTAGATRPNVGDRLTEYGGRGAPWKGYDAHNRDPEVVKERKLGTHDVHGGLKIDLNRGGPPRTEKRPFHYAFQGGLLGKDANAALNHDDEVLLRHSAVGFPRWDAEGEALPAAPPRPPPPPFIEKGETGDDLSEYLDKAIDYDRSTPRGPSPHQVCVCVRVRVCVCVCVWWIRTVPGGRCMMHTHTHAHTGCEQDDEGLFGDQPRAQDDDWDADKVQGPEVCTPSVTHSVVFGGACACERTRLPNTCMPMNTRVPMRQDVCMHLQSTHIHVSASRCLGAYATMPKLGG